MTPPSGSVAGIISRTDMGRGVWKAPAGTKASLKGAKDLQPDLTDDESGRLNAIGVNGLRSLPQFGHVIWGARTLSSDPEWKYLPVRRTALFIEESLSRGLTWVVFEPNDDCTRG